MKDLISKAFGKLMESIPQKHKVDLPVVETKIQEIPFDPARDGMKPAQGMAWNPMLKYPPNESCYCRSGLKFKKCCKLKQPLVVDIEFEKQARPLIDKIRNENKGD